MMEQFEPAKFNVGDIVVSKHYPNTDLVIELVRIHKSGGVPVYLTSLAIDGDLDDIYFEDELCHKEDIQNPNLEIGAIAKVTGLKGEYQIYQHLGYKSKHQEHEYLLAKRNKNNELQFIQILETDILVIEKLTKDQYLQGLEDRINTYLDLYNLFKDKKYLRRVKRLDHFYKKARNHKQSNKNGGI
ncbi:hypothetical protein SAMN05444392_102258 [Seinonella peptonophila]|uniref:Uncharacterized protein n=1 Tax=Seinonella peptonophila TaxID=112248 RepID=A0A1M4VAB9_9BACL|nr:hypothetical protein [Seinonella peptonophila]SHE65833.1 hypothetical protein SAMN05444392_102258 [Seinonella peptonophila]